MANEINDPRMTTIHPRIRYNTIGGVNGPLVILENVRPLLAGSVRQALILYRIGQISKIQ